MPIRTTYARTRLWMLTVLKSGDPVIPTLGGESASNKSASITNSNTQYPTCKAVKDYADQISVGNVDLVNIVVDGGGDI